ncbi:hypothetical protein SSS_04938 [Sarcoptes scabiei]|nr:hypothetical protein SSS_04938 [Sarcoptes scabiei]
MKSTPSTSIASLSMLNVNPSSKNSLTKLNRKKSLNLKCFDRFGGENREKNFSIDSKSHSNLSIGRAAKTLLEGYRFGCRLRTIQSKRSTITDGESADNSISKSIDVERNNLPNGFLSESSTNKIQLAVHRSTSQLVAIKIINKNRLKNIADLRSIRWEINLLKNCYHKNILRLLQYEEDEQHIFVVKEYCSNGDLREYLNRNGRFTIDEIVLLFADLIDCLNSLQERGFYHGAIKPENILLDQNNRIKLIGFRSIQSSMAVCGVVTDRLQQSNTLGESGGEIENESDEKKADFPMMAEKRSEYYRYECLYCAPEIQTNQIVRSSMIDVWSCGVLLYFLITEQMPFIDDNLARLLKKIESGNFVTNHPSLNDDDSLLDLLKRMLKSNPLERIEMKQISKHPWLREHWLLLNREYFYSSNNKSVDQDNLGLDEEILLECQRILSDRFEDLVELRYNILYNYSIQTATYWLLFEKKRSQTNQKFNEFISNCNRNQKESNLRKRNAIKNSNAAPKSKSPRLESQTEQSNEERMENSDDDKSSSDSTKSTCRFIKSSSSLSSDCCERSSKNKSMENKRDAAALALQSEIIVPHLESEAFQQTKNETDNSSKIAKNSYDENLNLESYDGPTYAVVERKKSKKFLQKRLSLGRISKRITSNISRMNSLLSFNQIPANEERSDEYADVDDEFISNGENNFDDCDDNNDDKQSLRTSSSTGTGTMHSATTTATSSSSSSIRLLSKNHRCRTLRNESKSLNNTPIKSVCFDLISNDNGDADHQSLEWLENEKNSLKEEQSNRSDGKRHGSIGSKIRKSLSISGRLNNGKFIANKYDLLHQQQRSVSSNRNDLKSSALIITLFETFDDCVRAVIKILNKKGINFKQEKNTLRCCVSALNTVIVAFRIEFSLTTNELVVIQLTKLRGDCDDFQTICNNLTKYFQQKFQKLREKFD